MIKTLTNEEFINLFTDEESLFFIQIGANDGITVDPINKLIKSKKNWRGLLFEPGDEAFSNLKKTYKGFDNLSLINSAVSDFDGKTILYCGETTPHFTLDKKKAFDMFNVTPKEIEVDVISPKTIISKFNVPNLDLLQIDTEGRDFTILKSFIENGIFPKIVRFEYVNLGYENISSDDVINFLSKFGYDSFFVKNEGDIISILKNNTFNLVKKNNKMKKKIRIHRFSNEVWGRSHLPFFKKFEVFLESFFDVEKVEYNKDGKTFEGPISTLKPVSVFGTNPPLSDVDCVIENLHTGEIKVISFGEYFNNYVGHYAKTKNCTKVLLAHFNWHNLYYWMKRENASEEMYKVRPWIFLPHQEYDFLYYRNQRDNNNLNDKMFFLGSGIDDYRKCIRIIENEGYLQPIIPLSQSEYLDKLSKTKIAVSYYQNLDRYRTPFDYPGEFCYRDVEYMSIGVPFIRVEFRDTTNDPWIPNYHYISIPRDIAHIVYEKDGEQGIANLYIEKYNEVINDNDFLNYISKNQKDWFDRNITSPNIEMLTFNLLDLQKWVDEPNNDLYQTEDYRPKIDNTLIEPNYIDESLIVEEFLKFLKSKNLLNESKIIRSGTSKNIEQNINLKEDNVIIDLPILDSLFYKNFTAQQQKNVLDVFKTFLSEIKPARILEIGTAGGGLTLFLRDTLNDIGLTNSQIKSFDVIECSWYDEIRKNNIEINITNIFDRAYLKLEKPELIEDFIKSDGTTLVLCDGGNKISEFNLIAPLLKYGDFIMAHDYIDTIENFKENFYGKIWNWCEIKESDISEISKKENLVYYKQEEFNNVVWVCKQKLKI
jgi:FkbM family methyltransferase